MSGGPLSIARPNPDFEESLEKRAAGDTRDEPGVLDTIAAGFRVANDEQLFWQDSALDKAYIPVIEALRERDGDERRDYATGFFSLDTLIPGRRGRVYDANKVWRAVEEYRKRDPKAFAELGTREEFEKQVLRRNGGRDADQDTLARGNGIAAFAGGMAGEFTDPVNIASLPIGGVGKSVASRIISEGLVNAGIEVVQVPFRSAGRENLGETLTAGEAALNIATAGVGGAAIRGGIELAPGAARVVGDKVVDPLRRAIDPSFDDKQLAKAFEQMVPAHLRTPEQEAALFVMRRTAEVEDVNPFVRTHEAIDTHVARMEAALRALEEGRLATPEEIADAGSAVPPPVPGAGPVTGGFDLASVKAAIRGPESGGNDAAVNAMGSSASGRYQFIEDTFKRVYKRVYGASDAAAAQAWNSPRRFDPSVQEALMDRLTLDNAAALQRAGVPVDDGNLYLAHFAGVGKAIELARAPRDAPVSAFFTARAIRQNPTYLGGGKTVGEAIDTIRAKVGDPAEVSPAPIDPRLLEPELRDPALDAERPIAAVIDEKAADFALPEPVQLLIDPLRDIVTGTKTSLNRMGDLAAQLGTDETTLREALTALVERGDITQNRATGKFMRKAPPPQTAANQKRPRTLLEFLAERGGLNDYGGELQAMGIRRSERRMGAKVIRNVRREDGTVVSGDGVYGLDTAFTDAREAGYFPEFDGRMEDTYADALDGPALLLQAIGEELGGAPRYRMDDWDRLPEFKLTGSTEAAFGGRITAPDIEDGDWPVAQLIAAFREAWEEFGGDAAALADLDDDFLRRAGEFYDRGDAFLPEHALAMVATEDYERALAAAIREELGDEYPSYDPWNPEWDAEFDARFDAARARDRADGNPLAGSAGDSGDAGAGRDGGAQSQGGQPDRAGPSPAELDAAAAAKPRSDYTNLPPDPDPRFDEPDSPGIVAAADSAWHDIRLAGDVDPNIAARQAQEAQLGADAPMRAAADQDGTMGLGLFDAVDQKSLFDLGDGRGERSLADIRAEIDADKAAIDTLRSCMT